ncbi:hypothetical protein G7Y79_00010g028950 [Physcia stellaris]|nr:hypothetical protein G7Y79_00010g028950 [Physcia stellaris]
MSLSSSPTLDHAPSHTPTSSEASSVTPPVTPPRKGDLGYTLVNNVGGLRAFLDVLIKHMNIPPKLYSKAHSLPGVKTTDTRSNSRPEVLFETASPPPSRLFDLSKSTPELYVDAEGISLSRSGELSILIVHLETDVFSHTFLVHVHVLGHTTFRTKDSSGVHSLKTLFEDNRVAKVLFDCRMDSDAIFGQYGVLLAAVIDLQLMCLASRGGGGLRLPGLGDCLLQDLKLSREEQEWVNQAKARGQALWRPRCGGSMQRFNDNPLHEDIVNYCVVDAAYLPQLFKAYNEALGNRVSLLAVDHLWGNEHLDCTESGVFSWECRILQLSKMRAEHALDPHFRGGTSYNSWSNYYNPYDDDYY